MQSQAANNVSKKRPKFRTEFRRPCCFMESQRVLQIRRSAHCTTTMLTQYAAWECINAFFWTILEATFWHCLIFLSSALGWAATSAAISAGDADSQSGRHEGTPSAGLQ